MSLLRLFLYLLTGLFALGALGLALCGSIGPACWLGFWAFLMVIGVVFEHWRYKRIADAPAGAGWSATDERFVDPETGKPVTVYFNAATGERRYVNR